MRAGKARDEESSNYSGGADYFKPGKNWESQRGENRVANNYKEV